MNKSKRASKQATAIPKKQTRISKYSPEDSRFLFRLTSSTEDQVTKLQEANSKKQLEHVDAELEQQAKAYLPSVTKDLDQQITKVREFFLNDVAPRTLAAQAGVKQALEIIKRSIGIEVEQTSFIQFEQMLRLASKHKMAEFVVSYMGIKQSPESLVQGLQPPKVTVPLLDSLAQMYSQPGEGPAGHIPQYPQRKPRHIRNKEAAEIAKKAALLRESDEMTR
jgi:hypothetical protein